MLLANFLVAQQVRPFSVENTEYRGVQSFSACVRDLITHITTFEITAATVTCMNFYLLLWSGLC